MNGRYTLTATNAAIDRVQLSLCMFLYEVCNDVQFEHMSGSDFVNFLNLKPTAVPVVVRPRENLRICYLAYVISKTIAPKSEAERWTKGFLGSCHIAHEYYRKHCRDIASKYATSANKEFAGMVETALQKHHRYNTMR